MVEDRSIELTTLSPAGTTPAQADFFPIPIGDTPWIWEPEPPLNAIQTMTDYTLACRKDVKKVCWPTAEFKFGMCSYHHAWNAWVKRH